MHNNGLMIHNNDTLLRNTSSFFLTKAANRMRQILGITVLQLSIVICTSLFTYTVLTGVSIITPITIPSLTNIEDCAQYCGELDTCDGFTFDNECNLFDESESYILYNNTSSLYMKSETCGDVINASNYMQAWSDWDYSNCTDNCGMFGVQNRTRTWQPPSPTYKSVYGPLKELNVPCPAKMCVFPRNKCLAGYHTALNRSAGGMVCLIN